MEKQAVDQDTHYTELTTTSLTELINVPLVLLTRMISIVAEQNWSSNTYCTTGTMATRRLPMALGPHHNLPPDENASIAGKIASWARRGGQLVLENC